MSTKAAAAAATVAAASAMKESANQRLVGVEYKDAVDSTVIGHRHVDRLGLQKNGLRDSRHYAFIMKTSL